ncbi:MAG TPA: serine/threonine-protein kinase [Holophagaceae bacterium]|nr:serine/threonine-protein kinase [Holophagaceae bacterium]
MLRAEWSPPTPEPPLESQAPVPQRLGRFEIIRPLGQGGMGQVFLARDPAIGREVALKTISAEHLQAPKARERFLNEAKAAGALSHSNLITIHEFGEDAGILFLVMEYLEGQDLSVLLKRRALTPSQALELMAQVCDGLAYAHAKGVLHRDVKPSNVRVVEQGGRYIAKLMDFGVARLPDSQLTGTGDRVGTLSYMAPEYLRGAAPTVQCDLYPVGMMLHQALTGDLPQIGPTLPRGLAQARAAAPDSTREIPGRLLPLVHRALAANPADRFPTAEALAHALRAAQKLDGGATERIPLPPVLEQERPAHAPLGWIAVAVAGAALGVGWMLWKRPAQASVQAPPSSASTLQAPPPETHPQPPPAQPPAGPPMPQAQAQQPPPQQGNGPMNTPANAPQDSGVDLSSAEATVREHPQMALLDAERALRYRPNDARALALRVASYYWMDRYSDMLSALQSARSAGLDGQQLGGYPVIHSMLDAERDGHRIPFDLFQQMRPYLPAPPGGQQGQPNGGQPPPR